MPTHPSYTALKQHMHEIELIDSTLRLLEWDDSTYRPGGASEWRAEQTEYFTGKRHRLFTDSRVGEWIKAAEEELKDADPLAPERVNVREWKRSYNRITKLPQSLAEALASAQVTGRMVWIKARQEKDFSLFLPALQTHLKLAREKADAYGYDENRYDALLDEYEPGARQSEVLPLLRDMREKAVPLLKRITASGHQPDLSILQGSYPKPAQYELFREITTALGYRFEEGSLDPTHHPFCTTLGRGDTRITTNYDETDLTKALFSTLHEAGHGMYEQNLPSEYYGEPAGLFASMGIHESQSRLWENQVGRSEGFWRYWLPRVQTRFADSLGAVTLPSFLHAVNAVQPSFIRIEADELTYNLHILLRTELEVELLSGDLGAEDLPEAWNERFESYLGLKVPDDAVGCLQDMHWALGLIGYFPSYSLGNIYSAQIMDAAARALPDMNERFARGEFRPLLDWLREKVYIHGQRYGSRDLVRVVTGSEPDASHLTAYLHGKLEPLYEL
ncbi:carboxypeptidase M32 [bacterium]|nr:carboxypeptidase M32 [bacterium]